MSMSPVRPGSEEYLDSEKYQYRPRDYAGAQAEPASSLAPYLSRLNESPTRLTLRCSGFVASLVHATDGDEILVVLPAASDGDTILSVINLDPALRA